MTGWETWLLSPLSVLSRPPLMSLITSQYVSPLQRWPCTTVMFLTLHFLAPVLFQGELSPSAPEKREGARERGGKVESSKVTFGVSPLELVSSWQGGDSFNFSPTVRSSLFFKRLWDRYKQRKTLPDFYRIIWGAFFSPALSLCQKWAFSDSCQIAAAAAAAAMDADGLFSRQIQKSFPRYCKSRPGCFSTCSCPSVIGKSRWLAVWQSSGGETMERLFRCTFSVARWTFLDLRLRSKAQRESSVFFQVSMGGLWCDLWTSSSGRTDFQPVVAFIVWRNNSPRGRMPRQNWF